MASLFLNRNGKRRSDWKINRNACLWLCRLKTLVFFLFLLLLLSTIFTRSTDDYVTNTHNQSDVVFERNSQRKALIDGAQGWKDFNDPVQVDSVNKPIKVQEVTKDNTPVEETQTELGEPEGGKLFNNYVIYDRGYLPKFQRFDVGKAKLRFIPEFKSPCFLEDNSGNHVIYLKLKAANITSPRPKVHVHVFAN